MRLRPASLIATAIIWSISAFAVQQGDVAPKWQATSFEGETVSFPDVADGKPSVFIFWASWCDYCAAIMPYLQEIQKDYGADRLLIIAVNAQEKDGDPDAYIRALGFPLMAIRNGDDIAEEYGVKFIPGLMVVDGGGTVAYRRGWTELPPGTTVAELWSSQVRAALDELL